MAGLTCELCGATTGNKIRATGREQKLRQHLWRYLYHENVREAVSPLGLTFSTETETGCAKTREKVKLTFALSVESELKGSGDEQEESVQVCEKCEKELVVLEELHRSLERTKKQMDAQIERINHLGTILKVQGNGDKRKNLMSRKTLPKMQMVFAGATVGADNACQTLEFLNQICAGIPKNSDFEPSAVRAEEEDNLNGVPKIIGQTSISVSSTNRNFTPVEHRPLPDIEMEVVDEPEFVYKLDMQTEFEHPVFEHQTEQLLTGRGSEMSQVEENCFQLDVPISMANQFKGSLPSKKFKKSRSRFKPVVAPRAPQQQSSLPPIKTQVSSPQMTSFQNKKSKSKAVMKQCTICEKIMASNNMAQHMRCHTGEKPYCCDFCGARFSQRSSYNQHIRRGHRNLSDRLATETNTGQQWSYADPLS